MPSMHSASVLPMREAHGSYSKKGKGSLFPFAYFSAAEGPLGSVALNVPVSGTPIGPTGM